MRMKFLTMAALLLLMSGVGVYAQQDPNDPGQPDSMYMVFPQIPDAATNQLTFQIDLYVYNDSSTLTGANAGWDWINTNLNMDSAVAEPLALSSWDLGVFFYDAGNIATTNANDRFVFGAQRLFQPGYPPNPSPQKLASYYFTLDSWTPNDSIVIDTSEWFQGAFWTLIRTGAIGYKAKWPGPYIIRDTSFAAPTNLLVSDDTLLFNGIVGASPPLSQPLNLTTDDNSEIPFTLTKNEAWLVPSPTSGTVPRTINVGVSTVGLVAGTYTDVITVSSPDADNSPREVVVILEMEPPPPTISVTPNQFFFNAVAGEPNPAAKILTITNSGGGTLNWSASSSESWLSLSPIFGTDSTDVSVSVDITGLPFGEYDDTIVVTDPLATNDPVLVPVHLSIGSDLPLIEPDPSLIYMIIPENTLFPDPQTFVVTNGGAGSMTFTVSESSSRILSLSPSSGVAGDTVTVNFKLTSTPVGNDLFDTVWVSSNEAINSPQPVVFQLHFVDEPAWLQFTSTTPQLDVYECTQGLLGSAPTREIGIINIGGDTDVGWQLEYESDLFTVEPTSGVVPSSFTLTANIDLGLPLGTYLDTIVVSALKAVNTPETLIVSYNVVPGDQAPRAFVPNSTVFLPVREDSLATDFEAQVMQVLNRNAGCMPWEIENNVPWLSTIPDSGDVPGTVKLVQNAAGYVFGQYPDSIYVLAPSAINPSTAVRTTMQVWRFIGDWNYDNTVDPIDLAWMVQYFFANADLPPEPEFRVGDVNCDHAVDPVDLIYMVDFFFNSGAPPCLNEPYLGPDGGLVQTPVRQ